MSLPLMLAGPILRRVEPMLVSVWIALREEHFVQLNIWDGIVKDDDDGLVNDGDLAPFFKGELPIRIANDRPAEGISKTIRVGEHLHIAVVTLKLPGEHALLPDRLYSYNIYLKETAEGAAKHDLKTLKLLRSDPIDGKPNLALGYESGFLPSFALSPAELADLRILHGSCRRINKIVPDGLAWVDDFILDARTDPKERPHQLLLTGDQIYADDVEEPMLALLIEAAKELIGQKRNESEDLIPIEHLPAGDKRWPADEIHFPPGFRFSLTTEQAKLTSSDGHSHLLSFGDFAAMYLFVWSNACWPAQPPGEKEVGDQLSTFGWLMDLEKELLGKELLGLILRDSEKKRLREAFYLGHITEDQWLITLDPIKIPEPLDKDEKKAEKEKKKLQKKFADAVSRKALVYKQVWEALPKVRRALANVPTYMMFDDHEITDDWYLNPLWRDRVLKTQLGVTMIRNGMVAYALFQAWGNDPVKFESGVNNDLLVLATQLFPAKTAGPDETTRPDETTSKAIDHLLGLDQVNTGIAPPVKWHYSVRGAKHLLVALDNRTRRSFVSRLGPPGNVSREALLEQIPEGPLPAGLEVLILVAPLPVIGPPALDEFVAPLVYRIFDIKDRNKLDKQAGSKDMAGTNPDAIEAWAFDPLTFELLLKRIEPYRRVVILSGDVHNGSSQVMSYWKKGDAEPARFAQFTSSGMKNVMPWYLRFVDRSFAAGQRLIRARIGAARLGWEVRLPLPLKFPDGAEIASPLHSRLLNEPIHIPAEGWPAGTAILREPDFQWQVEVLRDTRTDEERPPAAQVEPLKPEDPTADVDETIDGYRRVLLRHAQQLTRQINSRQIIFANNLGRVRFEAQPGSESFIAVHELYSVFPFIGVEKLEKPQLFTLHRTEMHRPNEAKPEEEVKNG